MTSKRYTEEFKIEAVKHVTDRGYSVAEVAERLGTTTNSLYAWMRQYGEPHPQQANRTDDQAEIAKLKADWPAAGRTAARGYTGICERRAKPVASIESPESCGRRVASEVWGEVYFSKLAGV